jgi:hypothetical protein
VTLVLLREFWLPCHRKSDLIDRSRNPHLAWKRKIHNQGICIDNYFVVSENASGARSTSHHVISVTVCEFAESLLVIGGMRNKVALVFLTKKTPPPSKYRMSAHSSGHSPVKAGASAKIARQSF